MSDIALLRTGILGAVFAALCCFTPALAFLVTAVGLSAVVGWLDYMLFPILFGSMGLIAYVYARRVGRAGPVARAMIVVAVVAFSAIIIWLEFRHAVGISLAAFGLLAFYALYLRVASRWRAR